MRTTFVSQGGEWMLRQQELLRKEARTQQEHPSTISARSLLPPEQIARAGTPGSMLRIGLNPDPMKAKFRAKEKERMAVRSSSNLGPTTNPSPSQLEAATAGDRASKPLFMRHSSSAPTGLEVEDPLVGKSFSASIKGTSSAMHFLNQLNGFEKSPYGVGGGMGGASRHALGKSQAEGFGTRDLLYQGVSQECEGRYAYLKLRRKEDLESRFKSSRSITSNGEVGWRLAKQEATEQYTPNHVGTARGTLTRALAMDASLLTKINNIVEERQKMELILGKGK